MASASSPKPSLDAAMTSREWREWTVSVSIATLLHLGIAAALMVGFGTKAKMPDAPAPSAMMVELAPSASAPQQRVSDQPPGPEQVEQAAQPVAQPRPAAFDQPPEVPAPPTDALATKPNDPAPPVKQQTAADRTTAPPSSMAAVSNAARAPVEGQSSNSGASENQSWESKVLAHLEHHKRYPGGAKLRRQEDTVYVRFTIDRSGNVLRSAVWRSRGYIALDDEVSAMIRRASPVPKPPDTMGGTTIEMVVPVEFYLRQSLAGR